MKMSTEYWQAIVTQDHAHLLTISWLECVFKIMLLMNPIRINRIFYQWLLNLVSVFQKYFKEIGRPFICEEIS